MWILRLDIQLAASGLDFVASLDDEKTGCLSPLRRTNLGYPRTKSILKIGEAFSA
jgi:hypothetical protein